MAKGLFYSIAALLLIVPLIILSVSYLESISSERSNIALKIRGDRLASYIKSVDNDMPRIISITSKRALGSASIFVDINATPIDDVSTRFSEMMLNGTLYESPAYLESSSITEWVTKLEDKGRKNGFDVNIIVDKLTIMPRDSFSVAVYLRLIINVSDSRTDMNVFKSVDHNVTISIDGLGDPLYSLNTQGYLRRVVVKPNLTVNGSENVDLATREGWYMNSSQGPSFFDRLEGRMILTDKYKLQSSYSIGLETFADVVEIGAAGLGVKTNKTVVDFLYFNSSIDFSPKGRGYPVNHSTISWLRLDDNSADRYDVELIKP